MDDLSQRAISIARAIDRLPDGQYMIELIKPTLEAKSWYVSIMKTDEIQTMSLHK